MPHTAPPHDWLLRVWGDEAVAFDVASGDTHYLPPLALVLFETCRAGPGLDPPAIAARAAAAFGVEPAAEFLATVHEGLAGLHRIGLLATPPPRNETAATATC